LQKALKLSSSLLYGDACETEEDLKEQLCALLAGYGRRFYMQPGSLEALARVEYNETDFFSFYDEFSQLFRYRFLASDVNGLFEAVEEWSEQLLLKPQPPELVKNWTFKLLVDLGLKFQSMQNFSAQLSVDMMHKEIFELNSLSELKLWLSELIERAVPRTSSIIKMAIRPDLAEARQYVLQRLDKKISLEEVAEHLHMNPSYFSRMFSKELGETFKEFVTRVKMERAKELLDQTNHSIGTICDMLGYESQSYFIKRFKACYGITPIEYRVKEPIK
jgi:two-component system response regulator YesN